MFGPTHDPELEEHLRKVIREELEADRKSRTDIYWWIAVAVVFGPLVLVGGVVVAAVALAATTAFGLGVRALAARRRTDSETA